ncbi:hypothetical protein GOP47_0019162 [Adiantum capillus-veneris]|uniref:Uncharacterized protein n=1 Tax=Adiantum capillus-veneris TaxID=13818 RepID=A0A9D4UEK1_ADICA|nr:hypothetical protein GOP47_0019162 [Adiantum capillus-veneris]
MLDERSVCFDSRERGRSRHAILRAEETMKPVSYVSYVLFAALIVVVVLVIRFGWAPFLLLRFAQFFGGTFANLIQAVSGSQVPTSDLVGTDWYTFSLFIPCLYFLAVCCEATGLQQWLLCYVICPTQITRAAFVLSLIDHHHPRLVLLTFSIGMALRLVFPRRQHAPELAMSNRISCRFAEFFFYMTLPTQTQIWHWHYMVPLALLVCVSRTNEVFWIWRSCHEEISCRDQERKRLEWFHRQASIKQFEDQYTKARCESFNATFGLFDHSRLMDILNNRYCWPNTVEGSPESMRHMGYPSDPCTRPEVEDRFYELIEKLRCSNFRRCLAERWDIHLFQIVVMAIAAITAFSVLSAVGLAAHLSTFSNIILVVFSIVGIPILLERLVFMSSIGQLDMAQWFSEMGLFAKVLIVAGLPLQPSSSSWELVVKGVEGLELVGCVLVYKLCGAMLLAFLILLSYLAEMTKAKTIWYNRLRPSFLFKDKSYLHLPEGIIWVAEVVLDTRRACMCNVDSRFYSCNHKQLMDVMSLLEDLDKALAGDCNDTSTFAGLLPESSVVISDPAIRKRAITAGLFKSLIKDFESFTTGSGLEEFCSQLYPILAMLHRIFLMHSETTTTLAMLEDQVAQMLESFASARSEHRPSVPSSDLKLMAILLKVSMLLFHFEAPDVLLSSSLADALIVWLEVRKTVPGIRYCDFI